MQIEIQITPQRIVEEIRPRPAGVGALAEFSGIVDRKSVV
jgi:hypothetical protein